MSGRLIGTRESARCRHLFDQWSGHRRSAESYTALDRYFCAFAGETFPNRFYQHAGQTDRDHNSEVASTLPTIWD